MPRRAAPVHLYIFDADDTLRRTRIAGQPCPRAPDEWELLPGVARRLRAIQWDTGQSDGAKIGVASNQDQVGYGLIDEAIAHRLLVDMIEAAAGFRPPAQAVALCPHRLEVQCECRKPGAALLIRIMCFYDIGPERTLFVGNALSDREAAWRAGTRFQWAHDFFERP
jgi:D-glycero-D-manno-heptose 1,7-bisphosphate phosphatase